MSPHPPPTIINPTAPHQATIILLHGTAGHGEEFSSSLLSSQIPLSLLPLPTTLSRSTLNPLTPPTNNSSQPQSDTTHSTKTTLPLLFPSTKFIFPTGSPRPVTALNGLLANAWFDIHRFNDRTHGEDDSLPGLRSSVAYLSQLINTEMGVLDGIHGQGEGWKRMVVGGFSQGAAMCCMLMLSGEVEGLVGGWWVMSGWMGFRMQIEEAVVASELALERERLVVARRYVRDLLQLGSLKEDTEKRERAGKKRGRVYIQHGRADQKMLVEWGEQMCDVLKMVGCEVEMDVYEMSHWWCEESLAGFANWITKVVGTETTS